MAAIPTKRTIINISIRKNSPEQAAPDQGLHCLPLIQRLFRTQER